MDGSISPIKDQLLAELKTVREEALAVQESLNRVLGNQDLPADFPKESLSSLLESLILLPDGSMEGCEIPLVRADDFIPWLKTKFIKLDQGQSEDGEDSNNPLTRKGPLDLQLNDLRDAIGRAKECYYTVIGHKAPQRDRTPAEPLSPVTTQEESRAKALMTEGKAVDTALGQAALEKGLPDPVQRSTLDAKAANINVLAAVSATMSELLREVSEDGVLVTLDRHLIDMEKLLEGSATVLDGSITGVGGARQISKAVTGAVGRLKDHAFNGVRVVVEQLSTHLRAEAQRIQEKRIEDQSQTSSWPEDPGPYDDDKAHALILEGTPLPAAWVPHASRMNFYESNLIDLTPLAGLTALELLDLGNTRVTDLSPLVGLTALETLGLAGTAIDDLTPLAGLTALESLYLDETAIDDLTPLAGLTALEFLSLNGTAVDDLTPLAGLTALETLRLYGTAIDDLTPLAGLTALKTLFLDETAIDDLTPLRGLEYLMLLDIGYTRVTSIDPLYGIKRLKTLYHHAPHELDLGRFKGRVEILDREIRFETDEYT